MNKLVRMRMPTRWTTSLDLARLPRRPFTSLNRFFQVFSAFVQTRKQCVFLIVSLLHFIVRNNFLKKVETKFQICRHIIDLKQWGLCQFILECSCARTLEYE